MVPSSDTLSQSLPCTPGKRQPIDRYVRFPVRQHIERYVQHMHLKAMSGMKIQSYRFPKSFGLPPR